MSTLVRRRGRPKDPQLVARRTEEILSAAAKVFASRGYLETDVEEIASNCGLAKGTVYWYFPSKEQLFLAAVDRAMTLLRESLLEAGQAIQDPIERITVAVRAYFNYFHTHPESAELLIIERAEYRDRKTPTYLEHRKTNCAEWEAVYRELIQAGRFRDIPISRIVRVVSDLLYGTMFTDHFSGRDRSPDEQAADVLDVLFHGLLSPTERRRRSKCS